MGICEGFSNPNDSMVLWLYDMGWLWCCWWEWPHGCPCGRDGHRQTGDRWVHRAVLHRDGALIPWLKVCLMLYLLEKNTFPLLASLKKKRKKEKRVNKKPFSLIKGKCSHLGKTEGFSPSTYRKQQPAAAPAWPPSPALPPSAPPQHPQLWDRGRNEGSSGALVRTYLSKA